MDIYTLAAIILSISIVWISTRARISPSKLPPGPFQLPIIGNILHLGPKPHQSLAKLSAKYGPLISLKLGSITAIVVSNPETAKLFLNDHDSSFCSRAVPCAAHALDHDKFSMAWLPAENQWRKLRKICKEEMFSVSKLDASAVLRTEKVQKLCCYVAECSETGRAVDVGEAAFTTTLNMISSAIFSVEFAEFGTDSAQEIKDVVWGVMECMGRPNLADYFPVLKFVDPQGVLEQTGVCYERIFAVFDGIMDEKMKRRGEKNDFADALIDICLRNEGELTRNDIKHLFLDLIVAGTDTTSSTVEWAMTELLRYPEKMTRIRDEIGEIGQIRESDIPRLPYLKAVVKETFRLHPAAPLLVPHKVKSDVEINGYVVPKNAQILVNVWASGRDPSIWLDADLFMPERFLNDNDHIDYRGNDFELIPFGAGRRICPGLSLAHRMVHLLLATLIGNFGWKLEEGKKLEEIDMEEKFGITLQKAMPLMVVPTKL